MILREENFAAIEINWDDKVKNLKSLASEINIGLDSMVFIDDDEYNREMVKNFIPEVEVIDMPKDFSKYLSTIDGLDCFATLSLTKEDLKREIKFNVGLPFSLSAMFRAVLQNDSDIFPL